jgi:hypothetical protein
MSRWCNGRAGKPSHRLARGGFRPKPGDNYRHFGCVSSAGLLVRFDDPVPSAPMV